MCVSHLKDMCVIKTSSLLEEEPFSSGKLNTQKQKKERKKKNKQTPFSFEFVYFAVYFIFTCSHSYDNDGLAASIHNPNTGHVCGWCTCVFVVCVCGCVCVFVCVYVVGGVFRYVWM